MERENDMRLLYNSSEISPLQSIIDVLSILEIDSRHDYKSNLQHVITYIHVASGFHAALVPMLNQAVVRNQLVGWENHQHKDSKIFPELKKFRDKKRSVEKSFAKFLILRILLALSLQPENIMKVPIIDGFFKIVNDTYKFLF